MNILDQVLDFFGRLLRGRLDSVRIGARSKMYSAEARVKSKVANKFNQAIDSRVEKVKDKVVPKKKG